MKQPTRKKQELLRLIKTLTRSPSRRELVEASAGTGSFPKRMELFLRECTARTIGHDIMGKSSAVTYNLILSLVPILAIAFTFFKTFGGLDHLLEESIIPKLTSYFSPAVGEALSEYLQNLISNLQTGRLGVTALLTLILTVISLLGVIEKSFNEIMDVRHERGYLQRFLNYWILMTLTPFLFVVSAAKSAEIIAFFSGISPFAADGILGAVRVGAAFVLQMLGFTILYLVMPARRVRLPGALLGAGFATLAIESLQWINSFAAAKIVNEASLVYIYGSVPILIVVLFIGMRLISIILLMGMVICAAWQAVFDQTSTRKRRMHLAPLERLMSTAQVFALLCQAFRDGSQGYSPNEIGKSLTLAKPLVQENLIWLESLGWIWSHEKHGKHLHLPTQLGLEAFAKPDIFVTRMLERGADSPEKPSSVSLASFCKGLKPSATQCFIGPVFAALQHEESSSAQRQGSTPTTLSQGLDG